MRLYNSLSRQVEEFTPLSNSVTLYSCGPTVYDFTHLGHLRKYTMDDVLKRTLEYIGYSVKHVMNITDVGHLVGDDDTGQDKLEKGAQKTGETVWEIAKKFTDYFWYSVDAMNVERPNIVCLATEHIPLMIDLIKVLEKKGHIYQTDQAVYFDITTFPTYGKLSGQKMDEKIQGVRDEVYEDKQKRNPADFSVWFKQTGRFAHHLMHWPSPWGEGFPGWHIECSAMSMHYLGEQIDLHTGGIDHIAVHHENEIAQSEAATGKKFVQCWIHHQFLQIEGEKMSKSKQNFYTIDDLMAKGFSPAALRLLFLQTHYRQEMNFRWEALSASQEAYNKLVTIVQSLLQNNKKGLQENDESPTDSMASIKKQFHDAISHDLNMSEAVSLLWQATKIALPAKQKYELLLEFDQVLGLGLNKIKIDSIPMEIQEKAAARFEAKKNGDFIQSDTLRKEIEAAGFRIVDQIDTYIILKK